MRFSQALGFEGFPELQEAAREEYRHLHRAADPTNGQKSAEPLFSLDQSAFESARRRRPRQRRGDRAQGLALARSTPPSRRSRPHEKVLIAGTDQMAFFASYLRHLLMLLDLRAEIVASPSQEALSRLGRIDDAARS